jgi:hypothetical protein
MVKSKVKVGMGVSTNESVHAYYSGYGDRPYQKFRPGMLGTVGAVDVPYVSKQGSFVCVDFTGDDGEKWRVGLSYSQIVLPKFA